ncbi:Peptide-methionine (S)-S-oxide reductase, partial [Quaeritorhiza haematococci]
MGQSFSNTPYNNGFPASPPKQTATFAAGCFWGVEKAFLRKFKGHSVTSQHTEGPPGTNDAGGEGGGIRTMVGYAASKSDLMESGNVWDPNGGARPTYRQVCSAETPFAEAVQIEFDPTHTKYEDLVDFFYRMHDFTTRSTVGCLTNSIPVRTLNPRNRQGNDVGPQYRSAIFTHSEEQQKIAEEVTNRVANRSAFVRVRPTGSRGLISTVVEPVGVFWRAEEYHQ